MYNEMNILLGTEPKGFKMVNSQFTKMITNTETCKCPPIKFSTKFNYTIHNTQ